MCVLFVAWHQSPEFPLIVAANRDEFHTRPTAPLQWWEDEPDVAAGRDLLAGGTWLGVTRGGRFAAVTNVRDPQASEGRRSRGLLVRDALLDGQDVAQALDRLAGDSDPYAPFNLLAGDGAGMYYLNNLEQRMPQPLPPDVYALSNARLNTPWPKVIRGRRAFVEKVAAGADQEALLAMLHDPVPAPDAELPDTGVGVEFERLLSPVFIRGEQYGTRCSTVVRMAADGSGDMVERRFDAHSQPLGTTRLAFRQSAPVTGTTYD